MGVVMKGGASGNREDALPPVPSSGSSQPVLDTSSHAGTPSSVNFQAQHFDRSAPDFATPDFMPTGGVTSTLGEGTTRPISGSDVTQEDILSLGPDSGDESVFKGAPNYGLKGGPAVPGR